MVTTEKALHIIPVSLVVLILLTSGCTRKFGILRELRAVENSASEVKEGACTLIRTRTLEISVEPITVNSWKQLFLYRPFTRPDSGRGEQRIPKLFFFHIIYHNVSDVPIPLDKVKAFLVYDEKEIPPIPPDEIKKTHGSPAYSVFDFDGICGVRRLIEEKNCIREIDYQRDLIDYRLNFINPGDRLLKIVAFPWVPVEKRKFTVQIRYSGGDTSKNTDFEYYRSEYRTRGSHFTRPALPEKEQNR